MANSKTYSNDPNAMLVSSADGTAESPDDRTSPTWTKLMAHLNEAGGAGYESIDTTAATLAVDVYESRLTVSGTMTGTLPDGTYVGQRKLVRAISAASSPKFTLTVTTPETATGSACASSFIFDTAGQGVEFVWTPNSKWRAIRTFRAGSKAVTVGSTVLTGFNLAAQYALSVADTVSSTGANALPNGSAVGERCTIICVSATGTPIGSIDGVYLGGAATAYTHLGAIGVAASTTVVGDTAVLLWDGQQWIVEYQNGCTLS